MKIFVSSLITGMEKFRGAARTAITQLGHEPVMAENFGAKPHSPQIACLEGLRQSGLMILLLGGEYGVKQASSLSATHEEYREAKGMRPVIAFTQEGVERDADQAAFIKEVQGWEGGLFRGSFDNVEKLKADITRAIHEWELSNATGPLNPSELQKMAIDAVAGEQSNRYRSQPSIALAVIGGPTHSVLRPSEIEKPQLANDLLKEALFGNNSIFLTDSGSKTGVERDSLVIQQDNGVRLIKLDPQGGLFFRLKLDQQKMGMIVIKENLERQLINALKYAAGVLDKIDPTQRLTQVALATMFTDADNIIVRTQAEHDASPNSYNLGYGQRQNQPVCLKPAHRPRSALSYEAENLAEDFVTLLRRGTSAAEI